MVLKDSFNRPVTNIRISLAKQCNLSCIYCHRGGRDPRRNSFLLPISQRSSGLLPVSASAASSLPGVSRSSGPDLPDIIRSEPAGMESSLTTNGTLLRGLARDLKAAGLKRVNVSLDSLDPETYKKITGIDMLAGTGQG